MIFKTTREEALQDLENYINKEIVNYSTQRNFDFGPGKRKNVSCLSPYISHRLITEYEVVKKVLSKFPYQKVEKYIQEIFQQLKTLEKFEFLLHEIAQKIIHVIFCLCMTHKICFMML